MDKKELRKITEVGRIKGGIMSKNKIEKEFSYKGFDCVIMGTTMGHRCGYIAVSEPSEQMLEDAYDLDFDVHGGITYGGSSKDYPIISTEERFWLGFDCAHYNDAKDMNLLKELASPESYKHVLEVELQYPISDQVVRTMDYVEEQLKSLADQLTKYNEENFDGVVALKMMKDININGGDQEIDHGAADDILCKLLEKLGYEELIKTYNEIPKWYA
jgi:hypothetical protein